MERYLDCFATWLKEYKQEESVEDLILYWEELFREAFLQNSTHPVTRFKDRLVEEQSCYVESFIRHCRKLGALSERVEDHESCSKIWPYVD